MRGIRLGADYSGAVPGPWNGCTRLAPGGTSTTLAGQSGPASVSPMMVSLLGLDPATYTPSALHQPDRTFPETNCYVDLWIELLHARGISPESAMGFTCTVDFEGDQWTFFKPPPEELLRLH